METDLMIDNIYNTLVQEYTQKTIETPSIHVLIHQQFHIYNY